MSTSLTQRNQANARHSTGPRTPQGKAAACRNALRHGLLSDLPVAATGECQADWEQHRHQVCADLAPGGHLELVLAERVALLLWRQVRVARHETALIEQGLADLDAGVQERRYALPDEHRPSTLADLQAARAGQVQWRNLLAFVFEAQPAVALEGDEAEQVLAAFLGDPWRVRLSPNVLPGCGKREDLAHYCARRHWTVALLQADLAVVAEAAETSVAALRQAIQAGLDREAIRLDRALSDQEIALRQQTRTLPDGKALERIARYEAHLSRELARSMRELEALQARRAAENCHSNPESTREPADRPDPEPLDAAPLALATENCESNPDATIEPESAPGTETPAAALTSSERDNCGTKPEPTPATMLSRTPRPPHAAPPDARHHHAPRSDLMASIAAALGSAADPGGGDAATCARIAQLERSILGGSRPI